MFAQDLKLGYKGVFVIPSIVGESYRHFPQEKPFQ